jgi:hypothetical protein
LLVDGVGVDGGAHGVKVFAENRLFGVADAADVGRNGDGRKNADDDHDDHQLKQRETLLRGTWGVEWRAVRVREEIHHVEYFVPSSAVPWLLV